MVLLDLLTNKMLLFYANVISPNNFLFFILYADYEAHSHICIDGIVSLVGRTTLVVLSVDLVISPLLGHFEDFSLSCLEKLGLSFSSFYEGFPPPPL